MPNQKITITAEFLAQLKGMEGVVSKMKAGLQNANKEASKAMNFSKLFSEYADEYKKLQSYISGEKLDILDSKEALRSGEKIIKLFKQIQSSYGDLADMDVNLAKKLFPSEFTDQMKKAQTAIENYENAAKKIGNIEIKLDSERTELERLKNAADSAQSSLEAINYKPGELENLRKDSAAATEEVKKLQQQLRQKLGLDESADLDKELAKIKDNKKAYQEAQKAKERYAKAYGEGKSVEILEDEIAETKELIQLLKKKHELQKGEKLSEQDESRRQELITKTGVSNQSDANKRVKELETHKAARLELDDVEINAPSREVDELAEKLEEATTRSKALEGQLDRTSKKAQQYAAAQKNVGNATAAYQQQQLKVEQLEKSLEDLKNNEGSLKELFNTLNNIGANPEKLEATADNLALIRKNLANMDESTKDRIIQKLREMGISADEAERQVDELRDSFRGIDESAKDISRAEQEMENLKNQVLQFFSVTNAIQLFKRTVQSALNTVKELDAVMTETAVVTDFSVGDMWERLPEYSAEATKLGASIKDLYAATTLYYQQGLQTEAAMGVGIETMKMARIAGMEAAGATEAMTAALRGFNMEVNETNAVRVNDVYSELAAITAADTAQIATAMSKTASIAASANMEFETTAALLAQIIETTQEAPETAGTAMKTIIARFAEVKKLREEGQETGEDEEGEEINVNKIQGALRKVGISMDEFFSGTEGLDSILLKLAEKWGTLDFETQRYIATTAAGSRQQSRFIAMMSDYGRTMELATAANNSAGASQLQFDKTLDSMEAKLQKLKNAWDQFAMGLADNEILKGAVDLLTKTLEAINKLTEGLSGGNGLVKSIVSLMTVVSALKGGAALLGKGASSFGEKIGLPLKRNEEKGKSEKVKKSQNHSADFNKTLQTTKGLFGETQKEIKTETATIYPKIEIDKTDYLAQIAELNQETSNLDLSKVSIAFDTGGVEAANNAVLDMEGNLGEFIKTAEKTETIKTFTLDLQKVGTASMAAGGALSLLSSYFDKIGNTKAADALSTLSTVFMGLGSTITTLTALFPSLAKAVTISGGQITIAGLGVQAAWWQVTLVIILLVGTVALLVAAFKSVQAASPEGKLKAAQESAQQAAAAADEAAEAYSNLASSLESIEGKEAALEELVVGTNEWKAAVQELNNQILDLIAIYPELSEFVSTTDQGVLTISKEGKDKALQKRLEAQQHTQMAKTATQMEVLRAQQNVDYSKLDSNLKIQNEQEQVKGIESSKYHNAISSTYLENQKAYAEAQKAHYGSELALPEQEVAISYNKEETDRLAKLVASGGFKDSDFEEGGQLAFLGGKGTDKFNEFAKYGQQLIESENALQVFTEALLSSAMMTKDINEEYSDAMLNIISSEDLEKKITEAEKEIDPSDETNMKKYADQMGYEYEDGKFYSGTGVDKKEVAVTKKDIKTQLATAQVTENLGEKMKSLEGFIGKLNKSTDVTSKAFVNLASGTDGMKLTLQDLENIKADPNLFNTFYENNKETLDSIFGSMEQFQVYVDSSIASAQDLNQKNQQKVSAFGGENLFKNNELGINALTPIIDKLYSAFVISGKDASNQLATEIDSILVELAETSPENVEKFAQALVSIDWSSEEEIDEFDQTLIDLGVTNTKVIQRFSDLEKQIKETMHVQKNFNLDKVKEELENTQNLIKDIESREESERTFTTEEKDKIIAGNPDLENQFIATGLDEFTFVGNSMEALIDALKENTEAVLGKTAEDLKAAATRSQKWIDAFDQDQIFGQIMRFNPDTGEKEKVSYSFSDIIDRVLNEGDTTPDQLKAVLNQVGADSSGKTRDQMIEQIKALYNQDYGINGEIAQDNVNNYQIANQAALAQKTPEYLSGMVGDGEEDKEELAALEAIAAQAGITSVEISKYEKALKKAGLAGDDLKAAALQQATAVKKQQAAINEASEEIAKQLTIMDKSKKGTVTFNSAISAIPKQLEKAFGFEVPKDWLNSEENLKLVKKWAAGSEAAGEKIRNSLSNNLQDAMNKCAKNVNQNVTAMTKWLADFSNQDFTVWTEAKMDTSGFMHAVTQVKTEAEKLANTLKAQGYHTEIITTWQQIPKTMTVNERLPDGTIGPAQRTYYDSIPTYEVKWIDTGKGGGGNFDAPPSYTPPKDSGSKKKGGGGSKKEKWENPYDKYYNLVQKINAELRKREKLERRYQELLARSGTTATQLQENTKKEVAAVKKEMEYREQLLAKRKQEMKSIEKNNKKYEKYAYYDEKSGEVVINWSEINKIKDADLGGKVEKYISKLEGKEEDIKSEEDALEEQTEILRAIYDRGKDEYFDLENQIKDALISERQQEIDKLSAINDSINDTNSRLIDAMQSSIDKYRQDRENERTEEELSDKQRRLAYLQQDTSGANALEIMQLQEEIDQGMEDYTDQLIDQKINKLQEQNDKAAEQREKQISLMEAQLQKWEESGEIWTDVYKLMDSGLQNGKIKSDSELAKLLKEGSNFESKSELGKMQWQEDIENLTAAAINWIRSGNSIQAQLDTGKIKAGKQVSFTTKDGETVEGTVQKDGTVKTSGGQTYKGVYQNYDGTYMTDESYIAPKKTTTTAKKTETKTTSTQTKTIKVGGKINAKGAKIYSHIGAKGDTQYFANDPIYKVLDEQNGYLKVRHHKLSSGVSGWFKKKDVKAYKTGGLADFTGPAWLDGTKSKPEYVLNSDQTKAFFELVDVLGSLRGVPQSSQITGDSIYDVDINVESIGSDYDVEQLASTIKRMINDDARYRNNNAINLSR